MTLLEKTSIMPWCSGEKEANKMIDEEKILINNVISKDKEREIEEKDVIQRLWPEQYSKRDQHRYLDLHALEDRYSKKEKNYYIAKKLKFADGTGFGFVGDRSKKFLDEDNFLKHFSKERAECIAKAFSVKEEEVIDYNDKLKNRDNFHITIKYNTYNKTEENKVYIGEDALKYIYRLEQSDSFQKDKEGYSKAKIEIFYINTYLEATIHIGDGKIRDGLFKGRIKRFKNLLLEDGYSKEAYKEFYRTYELYKKLYKELP